MDNQPGNLEEEPQEEPTDKGKPPKGSALKGAVPKSTRGTVPKGQKTWYKSGIAYDTKRTGPTDTPPEDALEVKRKWKTGDQPKPSTSGRGGSSQKRKKTTPSHWPPQTQPHTTYVMGDKVQPAWGLIHKGSMDPKENWQIPLHKLPKFTNKQEEARQEAKRRKLKYKRYKPGQLALKEIRYYKKNAGFIIPISAIRRLCLEIGYNYKEGISFQLHGYRDLQEAVEWYLVRVFKNTNLLATHVKRITINTKDMVLARKLSGDYGQYNTWAWNSKHLFRPWAYKGKIDKEMREIRKYYLGSNKGYKTQSWKVKVRK